MYFKSGKILLLFLVIALNPIKSYAQIDNTSDLFLTLQEKDSLLFNIGFNQCDLTQFENLLSDSFEFYHDQAGITRSKSVFISEVKEAICNSSNKPQRELIPNSLEVYPMKRNGQLYGAIQIGRHRFFLSENNERTTSFARFTHLWLLEDGQWKLSRGLSYDHIEGFQKAQPDSTDYRHLFSNRDSVQKWLLMNNIPALGIGYIEDGSITEVRVFGELEAGTSAPLNTIWNVASLTKPVTAMVALKLVEARKWDLDEPISKYWLDPDIANDPRSKKLTTRHILSHQSGFPNWRSSSPDKKLAFEFEPGEKYQYSGEGFEYLRKALENKFKTTLNQLADSLIFQPLNMVSTTYFWDEKVDENRFAKWHDLDGNQYETYKNSSENGADDLLTTIEDYSKFLQHVLNGAGLSDELYSEIFSNQIRIKPDKYWGLSWWVDEGVGEHEDAVLCGGDDKGVHTFAIMLPKSNRGLIIFTNSDTGTEAYIPVILNYLGRPGQGIIDNETGH